MPETLRVGEVIDFVGGHFAQRIARDELAEQFELTELLRRQTGSLSGGQKRRDADAFVRALVGRGINFSQLAVRGATLEEAFLALTASGAAGNAQAQMVAHSTDRKAEA